VAAATGGGAGTPQPTAELLRRHVKLLPRGTSFPRPASCVLIAAPFVDGMKSDDVLMLPVEAVAELLESRLRRDVADGQPRPRRSRVTARTPSRGTDPGGSLMPRRRSFAGQVEGARRRAPKVGARAPQTLSGSDARWNDERPVCDPAVRTSLGGGRGEAYQRNATPQPPAGALTPQGGQISHVVRRGVKSDLSITHSRKPCYRMVSALSTVVDRTSRSPVSSQSSTSTPDASQSGRLRRPSLRV
jgi:hypothetical protein